MADNLIARLEAATEGSRELHAETAGLRWNSVGFYYHQNGVDHTGPNYTTSLDAALTLVPEEFDWTLGHTNSGLTIHAQVGPKIECFADTPALALCIAALKAREANDE